MRYHLSALLVTKCGLRTYKTEPVIWGDNNCEHDFSIEAAPRRSRKESDIVNLASKQATVGGSNYDATGGNFCLKCGAWKGELGLEPTIELYISHLLQVFDEVKRVLKKTGTLWVNIGDSYASGKGTCFNPGGGKGSFSGHGDRKDAGAYPLDRGNISMLRAEGLTPKSLCLIPERFALGMLEHGWILRNNVIWNKPNPMPESVKDRFTGSYEVVYFFVKNKKYWFEQQFEQYTEPLDRWGGPEMRKSSHKYVDSFEIEGDNSGIGRVGATSMFREGRPVRPSELGRNKRDVWEINTQPYPEAHFAVFPEKLVETPILSGCPSAICKKCGKARGKAYDRIGNIEAANGGVVKLSDKPYSVIERTGYVEQRDLPPIDHVRAYLNLWRSKAGYTIEQVETELESQAPHHWFNGESYPTKEDWWRIKDLLGFDDSLNERMTRIIYKKAEKLEGEQIIRHTDCGCNAGFEPGVVMDPFAGSGTTGIVAKKLGRKYIGIELNPKYCKMHVKRLQSIPIAMELA